MKLVLDASMTLAWLFLREKNTDRQIAEQALAAMEHARVEVPPLWLTEVANALLVAERRKLLTPSQSIEFLSKLRGLPVFFDNAAISERIPYVLQYAREYQLSSYDATYLDLVCRTGGVLATFDKKLAEAARSAGASVFLTEI